MCVRSVLTRVRLLILSPLALVALTACAGGPEITAMAPPAELLQPARFVEVFPGESDGCGFPMRDARVWNTHPARMINASFSRPAENGQVDYFSIDIPAGEIMTVENCSTGETSLIGAQFVDEA